MDISDDSETDTELEEVEDRTTAGQDPLDYTVRCTCVFHVYLH